MVLELRLRHRSRIQDLTAAAAVAIAVLLGSAEARAESRLAEAQTLYSQGQYFKAARYAFSAGEGPESDVWTTRGLMRAGMYNSASYFFIRTLQSGNKAAIRKVLPESEQLVLHVGGDVLRSFLIQFTSLEDYDAKSRGAFLYLLGKDALLEGDEKKAIDLLKGIGEKSPIQPFARQLLGTANAILGRDEAAIKEYEACAEGAGDLADAFRGSEEGKDRKRMRERQQEAEDLRNRCLAGVARVLYQGDKFAEADKAYDRVEKASFVWPDILFEQAWNSFARREYNRSLGKLVSYKSPALKFVFNTEVDVLRAQSFLALCLYDDANSVINEFNSKYTKVGEDVKRFVESSASNLPAFYEAGKKALQGPVHAKNDFNRMMNRFVRAPYFQNLVSAERGVQSERLAIKAFTRNGAAGRDTDQGFPGFLDEVLDWRRKAVSQLGGAFVKNSLIDYHGVLIADFEKMAFIKLEMLGRAKERLVSKRASQGDRLRGNVEPSRRDDQYYWGFNGEFWNDELGDYVFGLESECEKS